ncbi:MAG: isopentenyl-diphosphate Delta-isomerase [Bacteroidetes bacterium]|nr:isopentenyl-diphosphate Delta-isomerase [Bacteroidales bacterium]MBU1011207.1 isopentenyl-diphosphate Delta-isomerase [Bacteroidota bacterium]
MENEFVILVDVNDVAQGLMEKMQAHREAVLHRAFSVFLFNSNNELLLQQRALGKYHSPGLWTNTCCSHPRQHESVHQAADRRLLEEMGMKAEMKEVFSFIYKADVGQGLTEHELDHVLIGYSDDVPQLNPAEVNSWKYATMSAIREDMREHPESYTVWFRIIFDRVDQYLHQHK